MARVHEAGDWRRYVMDFRKPHREIEPLEAEIGAVDAALAALVEAAILPHTRYDAAKALNLRAAARDRFDIPWTAITPSMQRLLYAVNAIAQPRVMVAVGVFCGYTFICNAGAAMGPGSCYRAERLVGLEIQPEEADRARRNVATLAPGDDGEEVAEWEIVAADGVAWLGSYRGSIDLLYLDANGQDGTGKSIYLTMLQAAVPNLGPGSLVLAHNSVNAADDLADYLAYVRNPAHFRESVNVVLDDQGLEVSLR